MSPTRVEAGLLLGGCDPALVDAVAAEVMGLAPERIPLVQRALGGALLASGAVSQVERVFDGPPATRRFRAPRSWPSLG